MERDQERALALEPSTTVALDGDAWSVRMDWMGSDLGRYEEEPAAWTAARRIAEARAGYARRSPSMPMGERPRSEPSRLAAPMRDLA